MLAMIQHLARLPLLLAVMAVGIQPTAVLVVLVVALVVTTPDQHQKPEVLEILRPFHHHKVTTAETAEPETQLAAAVVAALAQLAEHLIPQLPETVVLVRHHLFLAAALPTQAAVVAVDLHPMDWLLARAVLVVAEMDQRGLVRRLLLLRLILEAVAVVVLARVAQAARAAPAS